VAEDTQVLEGQGAAPSQGQGTAPDNGQGDQVWWKAPDGTAFKSPDDLGKVYQDGLMMRKDYTKKTQTLAEERRAHEQERKQFQLDREEHLRVVSDREARAKEHEQFDRFVKQYPAKYKAWLAEIKKGPGPDDVAERVRQEMEEKYGSKLSELDNWKAQQEAERLRNEAYAGLKGKYSDFDADSVNKRLEELTAKLRDGDIGYLAEMLFLSNRATKATPERIEEDKRSAQLLPGSSAPAPQARGKAHGSIREAERKALESLKR